ncbi:AraC-like DNA-binding protein [Natronocella acetinitrilica]|uniref:AraC-like DNA-binding protein n=1 Tax=Natronocella acetinitrilica TaxID=414046 RepID=A0AAE3KI44_9GAMM|nr:AraC family transcriptional regulator [Natronocella acetinitrilica]MCP1677002.1 AraC-like DNA-binding protein [Natronocella acetinitrilica]
MHQIGGFRLLIWPYRWLLVGPGLDAELHRHHLAQLTIGVERAIAFKASREDPWQWASAFYVPPDVTHALRVDEGIVAVLYLDPEGPECLHACQRFAAGAISPVSVDPIPQAESARRLADPDIDCGEADAVIRRILGQRPATAPARDTRLQAALQWLDAHLHTDVRVEALARAVGTSESWMTHNFSRMTGLPIRRYVLWRRLRLAVEAALAGATLTEAAHHAGFADSAHLSRTFRDNFGITPSRVLSADIQVELAPEADALSAPAHLPGGE